MKGVLVVEDLGTCGMPGGGSVLDLSIACLPPLMSSLSSAQTRAGAGAGVGLSNNQEKGEDASGGSCVCVAHRKLTNRARSFEGLRLGAAAARSTTPTLWLVGFLPAGRFGVPLRLHGSRCGRRR